MGLLSSCSGGSATSSKSRSVWSRLTGDRVAMADLADPDAIPMLVESVGALDVLVNSGAAFAPVDLQADPG